MKAKLISVAFCIVGLILVGPLLNEIGSFLACVLRILGSVLFFVLAACFWRVKQEKGENLRQAIWVKIKQGWIWFSEKSEKDSFKAALTTTEIITFVLVALGFWFDYDQGKLVETQIFASNAIAISQLAEQSLWESPGGGNRSSYQILESLQNDDNLGKPELRAAAELQIKKVKDLYRNDLLNPFVQELDAICENSVPPCSSPRKWEPTEGFNAENVFGHLKDEKLWTERARAAFILRSIGTTKNNIGSEAPKKLYEKLIYFMREENEPSLLVSKMAFDTYRSLVDDKEEDTDVFDFERVIKDSENPQKQAEILKKIELKFSLK